jgi:(p)ppGpp synthase/HD superfamily hydrolase
MQLREHFGSYAGGLEHALALATLAHATQRERGRSSVLHPVRMALALPYEDPDARTVALLHDVIEDSDLTLEDLRGEGFPEHIVQAVDALTFRSARLAPADEQRLARYQNALEIFDIANR